MLIRADGGIADKHILKADILIYPSCYWRSLINMNVWLSFVNIVPFICLFFYVTVWRDVSNAHFVQMLKIQWVFRFALFWWFMSIFHHALQSVLCVAAAEKEKKTPLTIIRKVKDRSGQFSASWSESHYAFHFIHKIHKICIKREKGSFVNQDFIQVKYRSSLRASL